ncbi:MAG: hypothetical protein MJ164_03990 [Alphaproteobacteria bacterium]|nr:hypothetical protein [Alphaproteobacteria bacterium]
MKRILACLIGLFFAMPSWALLPSGYKQVEYVTSTGTQYFDTGVVGKNGVSVSASFVLNFVENGSLFGNRLTGDTRFWPVMYFQNNWNSCISLDRAGTQIAVDTVYNTVFTSDSTGWKFSVNGTNVTQGTNVVNNTNTMWMFGTNNMRDSPSGTLQYPFKGRVYWAKIYQDDILVRDFIPVQSDTGEYGMYDLVHNQFYKNQGSGSFSGGQPVIGSACNDGMGTLQLQSNLLDAAIVRYKGCVAATGVYPYADTDSTYLNIFFPVEPSTSYTYTTTTAGTRDGIYEFNNVINPDEYTATTQITPNRVIQSGTTADKYSSGTFTTGANAKMIMFYGSTNWPNTPKGLEIFPTNRPIGTLFCDESKPFLSIKIATTKFVDEEFAPVEAKLATTVQTIESVVSRTITQTGQIATLQAEKQTRPDETCPAGKKCLLVEDEQGVPHWYVIAE